ncbi:MAG: hypothetical protein Q4G58_02920 [bacterium]|nr:hypothetical protein [bacterium]
MCELGNKWWMENKVCYNGYIRNAYWGVSSLEYEIISGTFDTGTDEQQAGYVKLFGEEKVQERFELYFHWFNVVHEVGHILVEQQKKRINPVEEELLVNQFTLAYWKHVGGDAELEVLKEVMTDAISKMPNPIPSKQTFTEYFKRIWGTAKLYTVEMYGYFQLSSVLHAMKQEKSLEEVLYELGIEQMDLSMMEPVHMEPSAKNASQILSSCISNLHNAGIMMPSVRLELVKNPEVQCCQPVKERESKKVHRVGKG